MKVSTSSSGAEMEMAEEGGVEEQGSIDDMRDGIVGVFNAVEVTMKQCHVFEE